MGYLVGESKNVISVVSNTSYYVNGSLKDLEGGLVTVELMKKNPNVMFVIARSCNTNIVAYEGKIDSKHSNKLNEDDPIDIYWLNLDPKYAEKNRKNKIPHDRDELTWPERKLGYGASAKTTKKKQGIFTLKMNALPSLKIKMGIDPKTNRPKALIYLHPTNDKPPGDKTGTAIPCFLQRIFVHVIWKHAIPDVDWLIYYGISTIDQKLIQQKITRNI